MSGHEYLGFADLPHDRASFRCSCGRIGDGLRRPARSYSGDWQARRFRATIRDAHRCHVEEVTGEFSYSVEILSDDGGVDVVWRGSSGSHAMLIARDRQRNGGGRWFYVGPAGTIEVLANGWTRVGF